MSITWILVANESEARIFKTEGADKAWDLVKKLEHPEGRKRNQDINSDKYGRSFSSVGTGRSSMEPQVTPREHERQVFALHLSEYLKKEHDGHAFEKLAVLAPPHFLGELRQHIGNGLQKCISQTLDKDLPSTWVSDHELVKMLKKQIKL